MKVLRTLATLSLLLGGCFGASAQLEGDQWVLGYGHGTGSEEFAIFSLDFRVEPHTYQVHPDFHHFTTGTRSNVCDVNGELLLETNGMELLWMEDDDSFDTIASGPYWDFNDGGTFAIGTRWQEGATILPFPETHDAYAVVYHNSSWHSDGGYVPDRIMWTKVQTTASERPETLFKDSVISPSDTWYSYGMVAVRHANGRDWWVSVFKRDSPHYYSLLLDPSGFKIAYQGAVDTVVYTGLGQMAFSWQGSYLARVDALTFDDEIITLFAFDRCSGELNRMMTTVIEFGNWSGIAFSPDERYLYVGNRTSMYQWDLQADDIKNSQTRVDSSPFEGAFGPMRTGPDGRVYSIPGAGNSLYGHIIDRPYLPADEQPELRRIAFPRNNARALPNNPNYRLGPIDGSPCDTLGIDNLPVARWRWMVEDVIDLQHIAFTDLSFYEPTQWHWDFGDGSTSTEIHPEHRYDEAGLYHVCLTVSNEFATDSSCQWIEVDMTSATDDPASAAPSLRISPNPFSGTIRISLGEDHQVQWHHLRIHDMHGRVVLDQEVPVPSVIHLEHLAAGVYACALYADGALVGSEVVMKFKM